MNKTRDKSSLATMKKTTITFSVLTALAVPSTGVVAAMDVRPFGASFGDRSDNRSLLNTQDEPLIIAQTLQDVIREQIRQRVETGEFGESELGEDSDDDFDDDQDNDNSSSGPGGGNENGDDGNDNDDDDSDNDGDNDNDNDNDDDGNDNDDDSEDDDDDDSGGSNSGPGGGGGGV